MDSFNKMTQNSNRFACELLQHLRKYNKGNLFFSPLNILHTLCLSYAGAKGQTDKQLARVLHPSLDKQSFLQSLADLTGQYSEMMQNINPFDLFTASSIWLQKECNTTNTYLSYLKDVLGASINRIDFHNEPGIVVQKINRWASEQTRQKIQQVVNINSIDPLLKMMTLGAVYFLGKWDSEFDSNYTSDQPFESYEGDKKWIPMMWQKEFFFYARFDGFQAIELPYKGDRLSMIILLPDRSEPKQRNSSCVKELESAMDSDLISSILKRLENKKVEVDFLLPKFRMDSSIALDEPMKQLGVVDAFSSERADFSGIFPDKSIALGSILHKSYVKIDEQGTEAAAMLVAMGLSEGFYDELIYFHVDRPFVFFILDRSSRMLLFIGSVLDLT